MQSRISLEDSLHYGKEANKYARNQIIKGNTQLENNDLPETRYDSLYRGVGGLDSGLGIRDLYVPDGLFLDLLEMNNMIVARYESIIEITSKYSLGNCAELSLQALDYILHNVDVNINAEVYKIAYGDHSILVLNRDQNSDTANPLKWGENAVIADPWADKVFKASDYLLQLKNFYSKEKKNYIEDLDPLKHYLVQEYGFNTDFLRPRIPKKNIKNLKITFLNEVAQLIKILEDYRKILKTDANRIRIKYGDNDERILILSKKVNTIKKSISKIKEISDQLFSEEYQNNYSIAKLKLKNRIRRLKEEAVLAMQFSPEDQLELFDPRGESIKVEAMKFFGIKSETHTRLEEVTKDVNEKLSKLAGR